MHTHDRHDGGCADLAHFSLAVLAEVLLKGQQQLEVGFLDTGSLHAAHLRPPLPSHHRPLPACRTATAKSIQTPFACRIATAKSIQTPFAWDMMSSIQSNTA